MLPSLAVLLVSLGAGALLWRAWRRRDTRAGPACHDMVTGLPNRHMLFAQAAQGGAHPDRHGALLLIDLDHFKVLNDSHGHDRGDLLLRAVAARINVCLGPAGLAARLGGDQFVALTRDLAPTAADAEQKAAELAERLRHALSGSFDLLGVQFACSASIGVTVFGAHVPCADELTRRATSAMYQAKAAGRNAVCFFDPGMQAVEAARLALESDLRQAVAGGQFELHYQAQCDGANRVRGAEVLLRWRHCQRGLVPPAMFIPLCEATGLILPLGHWVLETACGQLAAWSRDPRTCVLTLSVNVSARQFSQPHFVEQVVAILQRTGADPRRLKLELTESSLLDNTEAVIATIRSLKNAHVGISLDDFGTGYSSLSYLKRLPLDQLKIDQSFVRDLLTDANDIAIVRTIIALGQSLGIEVIAEGVESEAQRALLAEAGCLLYQGYLFARPMPLARFEQQLHQRWRGAMAVPSD